MQARPTDNVHTLKQRYEKIIDETMEITGRFIEASERLMGELLRDMGFKAKRILFTEENKGKEGRRSEIRDPMSEGAKIFPKDALFAPTRG